MALINVETQIIYKWNTIKLAYWEQPPRMQRKKCTLIEQYSSLQQLFWIKLVISFQST